MIDPSVLDFTDGGIIHQNIPKPSKRKSFSIIITIVAAAFLVGAILYLSTNSKNDDNNK